MTDATLHTEELNKMITELSDALANLGRGTPLAELLRIIHHKGWTTPAEFAFAAALLKALRVHVTAIQGLQGELLAASKLVGKQERNAT